MIYIPLTWSEAQLALRCDRILSG